MILIQFLPFSISYEPDERDYRLQRIKRKEKRRRLGEDLEKIWRYEIELPGINLLKKLQVTED